MIVIQWRVLRAWLVHAYTATGLIFALFAVQAVADWEISRAAMWLAIAMVVDATDGNLARAWQVKVYTPHFDGRKLDDITDFLTYTFIPLFFLYRGHLPGSGWQWTLLLALLASAYGFSSEDAKTEDGFFTGFPSYWNAVALYLYWLQLPAWLAGTIIMLLALMTFLPLKFMSFNQTRELRKTDRILLLSWAGMLIWLFQNFENPNWFWVCASLFYPIFYFLASFYLHWILIRKKVKGSK